MDDVGGTWVWRTAPATGVFAIVELASFGHLVNTYPPTTWGRKHQQLPPRPGEAEEKEAGHHGPASEQAPRRGARARHDERGAPAHRPTATAARRARIRPRPTLYWLRLQHLLVPHHREGLERRRALPHRQAAAAQPDAALAGHRLRLRRRPASQRARARRSLGRGPAGLRDRRHGQRPDDLRRDDPQHQPRGVQAPADDLHRAALLRGAHRLHRVQGEPRVQGPPPRARVVQGRAVADRARHHARGRARADLSREGRQPRSATRAIRRTRGQRDRHALRASAAGSRARCCRGFLRLRLENAADAGPARRASSTRGAA